MKYWRYDFFFYKISPVEQQKRIALNEMNNYARKTRLRKVENINYYYNRSYGVIIIIKVIKRTYKAVCSENDHFDERTARD